MEQPAYIEREDLQSSATDVFELDSDSSSIDDEESSVDNEMEEKVPIDIFSSQIPSDMPSDIASVELAIAKQMASLTVEAREKAYLDMHGVPDSLNESSELIRQSLAELQNEIDSIGDRDAYNLAWNTDHMYVEDEEFRVRFLRADEMNA